MVLSKSYHLDRYKLIVYYSKLLMNSVEHRFPQYIEDAQLPASLQGGHIDLTSKRYITRGVFDRLTEQVKAQVIQDHDPSNRYQPPSEKRTVYTQENPPAHATRLMDATEVQASQFGILADAVRNSDVINAAKHVPVVGGLFAGIADPLLNLAPQFPHEDEARRKRDAAAALYFYPDKDEALKRAAIEVGEENVPATIALLERMLVHLEQEQMERSKKVEGWHHPEKHQKVRTVLEKFWADTVMSTEAGSLTEEQREKIFDRPKDIRVIPATFSAGIEYWKTLWNSAIGAGSMEVFSRMYPDAYHTMMNTFLSGLNYLAEQPLLRPVMEDMSNVDRVFWSALAIWGVAFISLAVRKNIQMAEKFGDSLDWNVTEVVQGLKSSFPEHKKLRAACAIAASGIAPGLVEVFTYGAGKMAPDPTMRYIVGSTISSLGTIGFLWLNAENIYHGFRWRKNPDREPIGTALKRQFTARRESMKQHREQREQQEFDTRYGLIPDPKSDEECGLIPTKKTDSVVRSDPPEKPIERSSGFPPLRRFRIAAPPESAIASD